MRNSFFQREEFDQAMYSCFVYGDHHKIAKDIGSKPRIVSQYVNPNHERESILFKAACFYATWIGHDRERGLEALRRYCHFVMLADPQYRPEEGPVSLFPGYDKVAQVVSRLKESIKDFPLVRLRMREAVDKRRRKAFDGYVVERNGVEEEFCR